VSQILIDREILRRMVEKHFELEVDNRAYRALLQRALLSNPGPAGLMDQFLHDEREKQSAQYAGSLRLLRDTQAAEDDAAFLRLLSSQFPSR